MASSQRPHSTTVEVCVVSAAANKALSALTVIVTSSILVFRLV